MTVKGKADDLPVFALLGQHQVRSRFEVVAQRGLTQFVGRYPELQRLLAALMQAERVEGQVVSVVGEAGIGKSRLLHEFKQHLEHEDVPYVEGSCFAYGNSISFYVAAVVKPPCVCFFPHSGCCGTGPRLLLAPSFGVGTSCLARLFLRAGSHACQPFLEAS